VNKFFIFGILGFTAITWYILRMKDITNMARTIWGEARGDDNRNGLPDEMHAVANVIMNRVGAKKWFSGTVSEVVLKPFQFSVWNKTDKNYPKIIAANEKTPGFLIALELASRAMQGTLPDITMGATHYHTKSVSPKWSRGQQDKITTVIGEHVFYKDIN